MKIDIITIFPFLLETFTKTSIIEKAQSKGLLSINIINLRDYASGKNHQVDDTPYGGGAGMVLMFPPIYKAISKLKGDNTKVIMLSPQGNIFSQEKAISLSKEEHLILLCGRYEGFDERIYNFIDYEISIGDYILMGGEVPAMAITEAIVRLIPNVIEESSHKTDSLSNNLLKYPQYTKPREYKGYNVPSILLSGDHEKIAKWRNKEQIERTKRKRPDLLKRSNKK